MVKYVVNRITVISHKCPSRCNHSVENNSIMIFDCVHHCPISSVQCSHLDQFVFSQKHHPHTTSPHSCVRDQKQYLNYLDQVYPTVCVCLVCNYQFFFNCFFSIVLFWFCFVFDSVLRTKHSPKWIMASKIACVHLHSYLDLNKRKQKQKQNWLFLFFFGFDLSHSVISDSIPVVHFAIPLSLVYKSGCIHCSRKDKGFRQPHTDVFLLVFVVVCAFVSGVYI